MSQRQLNLSYFDLATSAIELDRLLYIADTVDREFCVKCSGESDMPAPSLHPPYIHSVVSPEVLLKLYIDSIRNNFLP